MGMFIGIFITVLSLILLGGLLGIGLCGAVEKAESKESLDRRTSRRLDVLEKRVIELLRGRE